MQKMILQTGMMRISCLNSITEKYSHGVAGVLPAALKAVKGAGGIENFITGLGNIL